MPARSTIATRLIWPLRALALAAAILVTIAGIQLFIFSRDTGLYFAWTIKPPLTAAFLGASYFASLCLLVDVVAAREWQRARVGLPAVFVFTTFTLVVTLLHLDRFHFDAPETISVVAAWAWLVVYVTTPPLFALGLWAQAVRSGPDPVAGVPLPAWLRAVYVVQALTIGAIGAALLVAPQGSGALWPWPLSPLTAGAIGAWLVAFFVAGISMGAAKDRANCIGPGASYAALGALQLVAVMRFAGDMDWAHPLAWPYVAFWAAAGIAGVVTILLGRR